MSLTTEEKEEIKTYFLIKEGLEITEVTEFYKYLLLKPYGVIDFEDKIYINKQIKTKCDLYHRYITDISSLSNLTNLTHLYINGNSITDISPLSNLINLTYLSISMNLIKNISPLANLINLQELYLSYNKIKDLSPLYTLTNLKEVSISNIGTKKKIKELKLKLPNCRIW